MQDELEELREEIERNEVQSEVGRVREVGRRMKRLRMKTRGKGGGEREVLARIKKKKEKSLKKKRRKLGNK